ncbi:zinc-dependent metalloprotease [Thalassotalea sp. PLHSN55]|uniref:zinc-dependent metalloprotease n=1 Tax=Thalassotalea sp. PLHSN55 TaxID=3435888 RepID=UPI003F86F71F
MLYFKKVSSKTSVILAFICFAFVHFQVSANFFEDKTQVKGFYSFWQQPSSGEIFLEIKDFNQPFIFQSALPLGIGSNDIGLDRGQLGNTRLVQFERVGNKVFLRQLNTYYRANSANLLEQQAVDEAFASSIIWGFEVAHETNDKNDQATYINYTPFLLSDIHNIAEKLTTRKQGKFAVDLTRSGYYQKRSKAFPDNTELEAIITYKGKGTGAYLKSVTPDKNAVTVNLHHSLIRLPDDNYQPRAFHPYSGYWSEAHADYASAIDEPLVKRFIPRHRLNKKHPSQKVSEAVKPITYYLDPGVPEPIKSALLDGARWWNSAFEAIGYKNAFVVKMLPEDADPMDVRYNVIQWVHRATRGWSYGSTVIDPRTGEILKGHVTLGSLRVRQDYLIALGLTSPFTADNADTSKMQQMALARIRQLSAHEIGHTLGIAHNFAASANDRSSVMDYPHPLVTLDQNNKIDLSNAYTNDIGVWDKYVIAYGYSEFSQESEQQALQRLIEQAQQLGLDYMSDPDARSQSSSHASAHLWDNGEDPAAELERILKVRAVALNQFGLNSINTGTPLSELALSLVPIYHFHRFQVDAAAKLIGGINYQYQVKSQNKNSLVRAVRDVSPKKQQQAFSALLKTLTTDVLLVPENIRILIPPTAYGYENSRENFTSNTGGTFDPITAAQASAEQTIKLLLNPQRLARIAQQSALNNKQLSPNDLITSLLAQTVKQHPEKGMAVLIQQRVNEAVVKELLALWQAQDVVGEVRSQVYLSLLSLEEWLKSHARKKSFKAFKAHYTLLAHQITFSLAQGKQITVERSIHLPPGSPIGN